MEKVKLLSLLLMLMCVNVSMGQHSFDVFSVTKDVVYQRNGKTVNVKKGIRLNITDELIIPKNNSIVLTDVTNRNYRFDKVGKFRVEDIIRSQNYEDDNWFERFCKSLYDIMFPDEIKCRYKSKGVTLKSQSGVEAEIASLIFDYVSSDKKDFKISNGLKIEKIMHSKKEFSFKIINNTNKGYYVNVAKNDKEDNAIHVCYNFSKLEGDRPLEISLYVAPNSCLEIPTYVFINSKKANFFIVGSEREFSCTVLEKYLNTSNFDKIKYGKDIIIGELKK